MIISLLAPSTTPRIALRMFPVFRLSAHHHVHRSPYALLCTIPHSIHRLTLRFQCLVPTLSNQSSELKNPNHDQPKEIIPVLQPKNQPPVTPRRGIRRIAIDHPPPWLLSDVAKRHIFVMIKLQTRRPERIKAFRYSHKVRQAVPSLDALADLNMLGILVVELVLHEPLIHTENASRPQDPRYLGVALGQIRCVDRGFLGVDKVERVVRERDMLFR